MFQMNPQYWQMLTLALIACDVRILYSQRLDSFEGGSPRWRFVESDCGAQLAGQELSTIMPHGGRSSEMFELTCSSGQFVLMAYPIEPCVVLNEFQPSIWCRCASSKIRLGVRVVFPLAMHPVSNNRMTTIVWGEPYSQPGHWQRLLVQSIHDRLQQEVIAIRNQYDKQLNLDQPYIDALVINAYTGAGRTRVQLDNLDMGTMIPLSATGIPLPADWREQWRWRDDTQVQFAASNQLPIWVDSRGEQPDWLRSLGFNGLLLSQLPTPDQLNQLYEAGMSAISPPPEHLVEFDQKQLAAVKGWLIGDSLNRDQVELARQQAAKAERLPHALKRPLYSEALEHFWLFGRIANEVIVPAPDPISAGEPLAKRAWLSKNLETAKHRGQGWVSIFAGTNPALADQYNTAVARLQGVAASTPLINPLGLRHEVVGSLMSGAKGIVYRTQSPLLDPITSQAVEDRVLQAAIRWTNSELQIWSPWINFGQPTAPPQIDRADFVSASWRVRDAELIILQNVAPHSQHCLPGTRHIPLTVSQTARQEPHEVVRLTEGRMEVVNVQRSPGAETWQLANPNAIEVFVVTGNPQVLHYLRQRLASQTSENASDQLEIANYTLMQATELIEARFRPSSADRSVGDTGPRESHQARLMGIQRLIERGWIALQAQQPLEAISLALQSIDRTQSVLYESYLVAINNLATPQSSPLVLTPGTLKYHWLVADACRRSNWQRVELPGSQFTDLDSMLQTGWTQQRRLEDRVNLSVELVPPSAGISQSLRLTAYPKSMSESNKIFESVPGGYEGASLRIRSSATPVRRGQLVRVSALAHIRHSGGDPASGLLVYDNQAWTSLGQLVRGETGERISIELYRFVIQDGDFRLLAECRGTCDIQLESVNISIIEPATDRTSYDTLPIQNQFELSIPVELPANSANADQPTNSSLQR